MIEIKGRKRKESKIFIFLLGLMTFYSCQKPVREEFIGTWKSDDGVVVTFNEDSTCIINALWVSERKFYDRDSLIVTHIDAANPYNMHWDTLYRHSTYSRQSFNGKWTFCDNSNILTPTVGWINIETFEVLNGFIKVRDTFEDSWYEIPRPFMFSFEVRGTDKIIGCFPPWKLRIGDEDDLKTYDFFRQDE